MDFSINLAGWVLDDPVFHKKKRKKMALKHFKLPEMHFKASLFFHYDPPPPLSHPTTYPKDYQGGDRG